MVRHPLDLVLLPGTFAVCRLPAGAALPDWATPGDLVSLTRTPDELSVVCPQEAVPEGVECAGGWRCLRVAGTLDFALVGVLASLVGPLAEAGVPAFALSTFATDYLLLKDADLPKAAGTLRAAGHTLGQGGGPLPPDPPRAPEE